MPASVSAGKRIAVRQECTLKAQAAGPLDNCLRWAVLPPTHLPVLHLIRKADRAPARVPMEDNPLIHTVEIDLYGKTITLETGRVAKQANGAVVVKTGDSVVLVTACSAEEPKAERKLFSAHGRLS